jgi:hypothetical protein
MKEQKLEQTIIVPLVIKIWHYLAFSKIKIAQAHIY